MVDDPSGGVLSWAAGGLAGELVAPEGATRFVVPAPANEPVALAWRGAASCTVEVVAGFEPANLGARSVDGLVPSAAAPVALWLTTQRLPDPITLLVDRQGRVWWSWRMEAEVAALDAVAVPGGVLLDARADDFGVDPSELRELSWSGATRRVVPTPNGHHGFALAADGSVVGLAAQVRDVEVPEEGGVVPVVGDALVRWGEAPDTVTDTFAWWEVAPGNNWEKPFYELGFDWTHGSGLGAGPGGGLVYTSVGLDAAVVVGADGARIVTVGGPDGVGVLSRPHAPTWTEDDTLLLFNYDVALGGHALELAVDDGAVDEIWQHGRGLGRHTASLGQALRLPGGTTLVVWSTAGIADEVTPEGEVVWSIAFEGSFVGHMAPVPVVPVGVW
jgi:hypothetical protein